MEVHEPDAAEVKSENYAGVELKPGKVESYEPDMDHAEDCAMWIRMHKRIVVENKGLLKEAREELQSAKGKIWKKKNGDMFDFNFIDKDGNIAEIQLSPERIASLSSALKGQDNGYSGYYMKYDEQVGKDLAPWFTMIFSSDHVALYAYGEEQAEIIRRKKEAERISHDNFDF